MFTQQILIPADAEAYSYWPVVGRIFPFRGDGSGFDWDGNHVDNPYVKQWLIIQVSTNEGRDRLDYLVKYQVGRLESGLRAYVVGSTVDEKEVVES
jgi:hypothetical protein